MHARSRAPRCFVVPECLTAFVRVHLARCLAGGSSLDKVVISPGVRREHINGTFVPSRLCLARGLARACLLLRSRFDPADKFDGLPGYGVG